MKRFKIIYNYVIKRFWLNNFLLLPLSERLALQNKCMATLILLVVAAFIRVLNYLFIFIAIFI